jgi:hypothetical protein
MRTAWAFAACVVAATLAACSSPNGAPASAPPETLPPASAAGQSSAALPAPPAVLVAGPGDPRFIDAALPLLPDNLGFSPRPADYVRTVYAFAAHHSDVLRYVPCFCGCERMGHRTNDDCFVARRSASGQVLEWQPHGAICEICLDVAHEAMQLHNTGASVDQIRAAIDREWASRGTSHTNTPLPPAHGGHD